MALRLCKRKPRCLSNPSLIHLFSTSQNDNNENNNNNGFSSSQQSSLNSYFSDVKASRKKQSQLQQQQNATGSPFSGAAPSKSALLEEIRKEINERDADSDSNARARLLFEAVREAGRETLRKLGAFENNNNNDSSFQQSSLNSYFSDVKASRKKPSQLQQQQNPTGLPSSRAAPSKSASLEEIRKNPAEFRQRSAVPPPLGLDLSSVFREISESDANSDSKPSGKFSFEAVREEARKMRSFENNNNNDSSSQQSSLNSYSSDVKASRKKQSQLQQQQNATGSPFSGAAPSKSALLEEIRKEINERDADSDSNVRARLLFEAVREAGRETLRKLGAFENNNNNDSSFQQSSLNSYFSDVKASRKKPSQLQQQQNPTGLPSSRAAPSKSASLEEIRKNPAEFGQRSAVPPPLGLDLSSVFREISERDANRDSKPSGNLSFEAIREFKKNEIK